MHRSDQTARPMKVSTTIQTEKGDCQVSGISGFGSLSTASLSEMRERMFNQIDTSKDGSIDKSEFVALAQQNSSSLVDELFSNMDTDQDSLVSMIEFDATLAKLEQQMKKGDSGMQAMSGMPPPPPPPDQVFDTADANSDGSVTQDELTAVLGDKAADVFSKVDTDGDGKISRTEDEAFRAKMEEARAKAMPACRPCPGCLPLLTRSLIRPMRTVTSPSPGMN